MLKFLIKRILYFVPTLVVVSLVAFFLSQLTPGDPVDRILPPVEMPGSRFEANYYQNNYEKVAKELHLDQPLFYFSLTSVAYPDTFHRIVHPDKRMVLDKLIGHYGNWPQINEYATALQQLQYQFFNWPDSIAPNERLEFQRLMGLLQYTYEDEVTLLLLDKIQKNQTAAYTAPHGAVIQSKLAAPLAAAQSRYALLKATATPHRLKIPALRWHGFQNQYHQWISDFITGNFGTSFRDGRSVFTKIKEASWWTLCLNISAIFIAFLLSIPLGVFSATQFEKKWDEIISFLLFVLYSVPGFWMAMLLVIFFTTPQYGMNWFASVGLGELTSEAPFWDRFWERLSHLILPVFCLTYSSLAFIARQVRGGMLDVLKKGFIRTAYAKGVNQQKVIWHHALRNALFPLITLIALVFPAALGGSVVVEVIFNIPGMGRLMFDSILARDWPVVFMVLLMVGILNMIGNIVADILYGVADPRIKIGKESE